MQPQQSTIKLQIHHYESGTLAPKQDLIAVEEPLEIRIANQPLTVTMRTPGHDFELAAGFLFTEGIIKSPEDIDAITYCADAADQDNVLTVSLRPEITPDLSGAARNFTATSACGVCGKTSIDAIRAKLPPPSMAEGFPAVPAGLIAGLPDLMKANQSNFQTTGGAHAAWLCDQQGRLIAVREDVGRHNAVDKVIGHQFLAGNTRLANHILVLSGRAGFELVQKAAMAAIPIVVAIGAPTSLATELAQEAGITLAAFTRNGAFNLYCGAERLSL